MPEPVPLLSIVVPCYNHGAYIEEALASISRIDPSLPLETIIIDDGSTDPYTREQIKTLARDPRYQVIVQENQGVCRARNRAIEASRGAYILPLDADNRLHPDYPLKAVRHLETHADVAIVYGQGRYMGDREGRMEQPPFHLQALMVENFIDVCAVFRREVWESTGGFDPRMKSGLEDWEFWLHAAFKGFGFHRLEETGFDYRVSPQSRNARFMSSKQHINEIMDYMIQKHPRHYGPHHLDRLFFERLDKNPGGMIAKILLRRYFPGYFQKLVKKGRLRKYLF